MVKKGRRVSMEVSPPLLPPVVGEEARARFKLQSLMQDYEDLVKETEAVRNRLKARQQQKSKLSAEVKFLRRKFKSLIRNQSDNAPNGIKSQLQKTEPSKKTHQQKSAMFRNQPKKPNIPKPKKSFRKEKKPREQEAAIPSTSGVLDLNQAIPSGEEEEFPVAWENPRAEKSLNQEFPLEAVQPSCDLKLSVCRDGESGSSRTGKRKISWQDQVALRV